jgi:hypothetical protein
MPDRHLPDHPNLRHVRNEAKALRRVVREGDAKALTLMRAHVRRLGDLTDETAAARADAVEPRLVQINLQDLLQFSERDAERVLRAVDRRDLVRAIMGADTVLTSNIIGRLSPRVARYVQVEQDLEPELSKELIDASSERICAEIRQLISVGAIVLPGTGGGSTTATPPVLNDAALLLLRRPVPDLTQNEIISALCALGDVVTEHGWNACEKIARVRR